MNTLMPCPDCGAECFDGDDVQVTVKGDMEFDGERSTLTLHGKKCPDCGYEFAL